MSTSKQLEIADRAAALDHLPAQRKSVRNLVSRLQNKTFGVNSELGILDDSDMGVRVGDEIHHHVAQPMVNGLAQLAIAALIGAGGALAWPHLSNVSRVSSPDVDAVDNIGDIEIYRPEDARGRPTN